MSDRRAFVLNRMVSNHVTKLVRNFLDREMAVRGQSLDHPKRDLDKECGYPEQHELTPELFKAWYEREGFATRANDLVPDETWQVLPELYEVEDDKLTEFEKAWKRLIFKPKLNPWHYLHRIDRLSGIGHYGVLFLGFNDKKEPDQPVAGLNEDGEAAVGRPRATPLELMFIRAFTSINAKVVKVENNPLSPRYGEPTYYDLTIADVSDEEDETPTTAGAGFDTGSSTEDGNAQTFKPIRVHWTRILHVADNRFESEIYGIPRLQQLINRCYDLRKILGGSAEMFWKGGFPGYSVETLPDGLGLGQDPLDKESISEEFQLFMHGLQRYIAVDGVTIKSLTPQIADPEKHIYQQLLMVAIAIGCPMRVLVGSDTGQADAEDATKRWNARIARRQVEYVEPWIIRPFVERLQLVGVLPETPDNYTIAWRDLNSIKETDKADIALKTTQALLQYTTSGAEKIMPLEKFIKHVLNWSDELAKAIVKEVATPGYKTMTNEVWKNQPKMPPGSGKAPATQQTGQQRNPAGQTRRNQT